jgi:hypothetical protein
MKKIIQLIALIIIVFASKKLDAQCIIDVGPDQTICCPGGSVDLYASLAATNCPCSIYQYQWTPTVGLSAPTSSYTTASPNVTTTYSICITSYKGRGCGLVCCTVCSLVTVYVNTSCCRLKTTTASGQYASDIKIYPNPAIDNITIDINLPLENAEINIYDVAGRIVWQKKNVNEKDKHNVDISKLIKGIYFVKVMSGNNEVYNNKLLIE